MPLKTEIYEGWEFATEMMGADISTHMGREYVDAVEKAITELENNINKQNHGDIGIDKLQGFMLEEWNAGTYNVDAVAADSAFRAEVPHSTAKNSPDIVIKHGAQIIDTYSAKSYGDGTKSAVAQAQLDYETQQPRYRDMGRLVPEDQLPDARAEAHRQSLRNQKTRQSVSAAYAETERKLTDRIVTEDGAKSKAVTRKELEQIARESKQQDFKAEEHSITVESAIQTNYLITKALKGGYTAAAITIAEQLAPEIFKAIDYLIKHGELDIEQLKKSGEKSLSAGVEGFLRGTVAASLEIMCASGNLGESLKAIDPTALGIIVVIVMQTVKNSILVAEGKMTAPQMGLALVETVVTSGGYLLGSHIGGLIGQAIGSGLPILGYLLGSLIGTSFCVVYNIGKKKLISFCRDTGFTCFGLVEQTYELPDDVLHEMGIETITIPRTKVSRVSVPYTRVTGIEIDKAEYETIDLNVVKRGLIGVSKIGYVKQGLSKSNSKTMASSCPYCGAPITGLQCSYCGNKFTDHLEYEKKKAPFNVNDIKYTRSVRKFRLE